ncbi:alpha/beta fold hydrolase [Polaromonas sp.]|uniref:alpha/beta fold hydrolase n=1 Tax=Polaromonas sp. TaxID=1869339 RepID=UPI002FC8965B
MTSPTLNYVSCPDASGGHRMAYWQWGDPSGSHVVVCVHGLSRQGRDFDVLARALCEQGADTPGGLRVVCPDVVGRGESDWLKDPMGYQLPTYAADMLALLAQLHAQAPVKVLDWVGTSMGGLIGMVLAGQPGLPLPSAAGPSQGASAPLGLTSAAPSLPAQAWTDGRAAASRSGTSSAAHEVASVGASILPVRKLVLNDVGPVIQWKAIQRIGTYLGQTGRFRSLQEAADAMWAISTGFGPHTPEQWLALSRPMVKPVDGAASGDLRLHYDPAIAVPFRGATEASTQQGEAMLWQLYDGIRAQTLITRGAQSDLLSPQTALAMTQRGPHARLVTFEGVGHAPTLMAAEQVATLTDFLLH